MITVGPSINQNNLLRWYPVSGATFPVPREEMDTALLEIFRPDFYALPIPKTEDYIVFLINADPINIDPSTLAVGIMNCGELVYPAIAPIIGVDTGGGLYVYYTELTIPADMPYGNYNLVIYETANMDLVYVSNPFRVVSTEYADKYTIQINYRNKSNVLNYRYDLFVGASNVIRIDAVLADEQTTEEIGEYNDQNYTPITTKAVIRKEVQLETSDLLDRLSHDALHLTLRHSDVFLYQGIPPYSVGEGHYYRAVSGYERIHNPGYPFSAGSIRLLDLDFTQNLTACN